MKPGEQVLAYFDVYGVIAGTIVDIDEEHKQVSLQLSEGSRFTGKYIEIQEASLFK